MTADGAAPDSVLLAGFTGDTLPGWLAARLRAGLAGVCLFATNVTTPARLRELTDAIRTANPGAIIAIDEEGGDVTRLHHAEGSPYPGNAVLGRLDDDELTRRVARTVGDELRMAGVNLDLAPDVDVNSNPDNPVIGVRSFGADPHLVARLGAIWTEGLQSTGVAGCAKHFPGHGDTAQDSHLALPVVRRTLDELRATELAPFRAAIAAGVATIMTSHILLPEIDPDAPATFSPIVLGGILRDELGFDGVIVSDALDMAGASGTTGVPEAAVRSIAAGCDLLCVGTDTTDAELAAIDDALAIAIGSGRITHDRWADATARVERLGRAAGQMPLPEYMPTARPGFDPRVTARAFVGRVPPLGGARVIVLESRPNSAVGELPWGLSAAGLPVTVLRQSDALPAGGPFVVVGRDLHRLAWTRDVIDRLRSADPRTVVVDMGWPGDDRAYADIATFGGTRHVGEALRGMLEAHRPEGESWPRS